MTPNDQGDGDMGPNNLQNFPALTSAESYPDRTVIRGELGSTSDTTFDLGFFASAACDGSGFGEGEQFLGTALVTTTGGGNVYFCKKLQNLPKKDR